MKTSLLIFKSKKNRILMKTFFVLWMTLIFLFSMNASFFVHAEGGVDEMVQAVQEADEQLMAISKERFEIDQMITAINAEIPGIQAKNEELSQQLEDGKTGMEERLRVMYMYNTDDMLQLLFSSTSFSEFISRADLIVSVFRSDRENLKNLQSIQEDIEKNEQQLANDLILLNESKNAIVQKEIEMASICADRQAKLQDARVAAAYAEASKASKNQNGDGQTVASADDQSSSSSSDTSSQSDYSESSSSSGTTSGNTSSETSASDFDMICAIVRHEGGASYEGSLGVISCAMNRVDVGWGGNDVLSVLTAPYQFESYTAGYYKQFLGADIPETRRAVNDCMYGGIRSHNFLSFRSYETPGSVNICGNWYFNPMN